MIERYIKDKTRASLLSILNKAAQPVLAIAAFLICSAFAWMPDKAPTARNIDTQKSPASAISGSTLPLSPLDIRKISAYEPNIGQSDATASSLLLAPTNSPSSAGHPLLEKRNHLISALSAGLYAYPTPVGLSYQDSGFMGGISPYKLSLSPKISMQEAVEPITNTTPSSPQLSDKGTLKRPLKSTALKYTRAKITSSLYATMKKHGVPLSLVPEFTDLFAWDIDFSQDLQNGDELEVLWEDKPHKLAKGKKIILARFKNQGKSYSAVRFIDQEGKISYLDESGNGLQKNFLRSPVDFARISSHFSLSRRHPVLHTIRAHKGVDYAATIGTPIKATGDGKVSYAGFKGGYGRVIVLQHDNRYTTLYAHMSRFASGIRQGQNVRQGQVIGHVGRSGLATGPHLHYEFQMNGKHLNPLTAKAVMTASMSSKQKQLFASYLASLQHEMRRAQTSQLALKN